MDTVKDLNNPIPQKSEWPPTIDGTTDWEVLFESPETGLLAIISATENPLQLKRQSEAIIRAIFTRKRDQPIVDKVKAYLDKLIPENASVERFPVMQASVLQLLKKIKETRIERAAAYVEKKRKKVKRKKSGKKNNRRPNLVVGFFRRCSDALIFLFGLYRRIGGIRRTVLPSKKNLKKKGRKKTKSEAGKDAFFIQDAYADHGDGNTEWQDSDMYALKEGKVAKPGVFDDLEKDKPDDKYESWDDY